MTTPESIIELTNAVLALVGVGNLMVGVFELMVNAILLFVLVALAVALTVVMFRTRNAMLGFPSGMFWAVLGGYSYSLSAITWDIHYFVFFASLGMAIFCMLGAYGLREKRDTLGDRSMEKGEGKYVDEVVREEDKPEKSWYEDDGISELDAETLQPVGRKVSRRRNHNPYFR